MLLFCVVLFLLLLLLCCYFVFTAAAAAFSLTSVISSVDFVVFFVALCLLFNMFYDFLLLWADWLQHEPKWFQKVAKMVQ